MVTRVAQLVPNSNRLNGAGGSPPGVLPVRGNQAPWLFASVTCQFMAILVGPGQVTGATAQGRRRGCTQQTRTSRPSPSPGGGVQSRCLRAAPPEASVLGCRHHLPPVSPHGCPNLIRTPVSLDCPPQGPHFTSVKAPLPNAVPFHGPGVRASTCECGGHSSAQERGFSSGRLGGF